ncbi:MAG: AsmA family protein [Betaproteobacteria bacterium HGW-Betaproteobacteria-22]|nr:MAG: AsmA family protein [Betaproteobacteria bacterium HGW-Betaproteobacteria-22]
MRKIKKYVVIFLALTSLLIILPFFIPVRSYLNQAEQQLSEKLGAPVSIGSAHFALLPSPRLIVKSAVVGKSEDLRVARLAVTPVLTSLLSRQLLFDLTLDEPVIKPDALRLLSGLNDKNAKTEDVSAPAYIVRRVEVERFQLMLPDLALPMFNITAVFNDKQALMSLNLETLDGALVAWMVPKLTGYDIEVRARKWSLPTRTSIPVEKALVKMHFEDNQLAVSKLEAKLYDGDLTGVAKLSWGNQWQVNGTLNISGVSVRALSKAVSPSVYLSGRLYSDGRFSSSAKEVSALIDKIQADFKFKVNDGVLHGLDLVRLASLLVKQNEQGGETRFDAFSGVVNVSGEQYRLRDLKVSSGLLAASGQVKIKADKTLEGAVAVELKRSASLVAIPLDVSGTLTDPVVLPSKAALAGAIAGTAVLGPGVGTSLGVKAGEALGKVKGLFQSK